MSQDFTIKDSGKRTEFAGGMVRDTTEGKTDYLLIKDGPMFKRWAIHLTKGAQKYAARNWMLASDDAALQRARESAFRHFNQWLDGDRDEDHAAAVFFNINQVEYIKENQGNKKSLTEPGQIVKLVRN
jgi:hypothetical protein